MPLLRVCKHPGCGKPTPNRYCEQHKTRSDETSDAVDARYNTSEHEHFREAVRMQNPMCQKLDKKGVPCRNLAKILHHLISPRVRPDLFFDPKNVVMLCAHCHPSDAGTPWWRPGVDYVATVFQMNVV
jgi:hypothetical protein